MASKDGYLAGREARIVALLGTDWNCGAMRLSNTMRGHITNWIAVVAVLAVTLLGAVAINRTASDRDKQLSNAIVAQCERTNTGRLQIDAEFSRLDRVIVALDGALRVAQKSHASVDDRINYARYRAILESSPSPRTLPIMDCKDVVK